ncbi:type I DNA topoisomerase [Azotobacter vinelandii]|uniref:type I DNA topoisomerase n=1 Tax=Azotobacter vinelandii TaxID=354 RepID=UPI000918069B|nr:type I DNA topoisomerase [Azotobacter vinelandii]WKN23198.1 type I DNA topoisomerase [Azotobacter vinelandii]SFY08956.1 DNA topoisomerase I [Azotobacter vinelandii]
MKLLIIEAPGKLEKLGPMMKKLRPGENWKVIASGGHIRDLPEKGQDDSMITTGVRKDFRPVYEVLPKSVKRVKEMREALKQASEVYIATDPDREGESIAWHIQQALGIREYQRITYNEITQQRVREALENPRKIDMQRVASQECRRVLDRLVGYLVTQQLRRVMGQPTSAGRVQTPAVYLVVLREREIRNFVVIHHFGVRLTFLDQASELQWTADWNPVPDFASEAQPHVQDGVLANAVAGIHNVIVELCEDRKVRRQPPAPFISSTLQQAASNALKWDPDKTMQIAQRLYEQGVITYHRTDNPNVADESMEDIRSVARQFGLEPVEERRRFKAADGAQEGHPAITPTYWADQVAGETAEEQALYKLIRTRALASQLVDAIYDVRTARLLAMGPDRKPLRFTATGSTIAYPGWKKLLQGDDTEEEDGETPKNPVPALSPKQILPVHHGEVLNQKTKAPPRYTKASLVKELERRGIGRPSTFAAIIKNITGKGLVIEKNRKLQPGQLGEATIDQLEGIFSFVELEFTRALEKDLDKIAQGQESFGAVVGRLYERLQKELEALQSRPGVPMQRAGGTSSSTPSDEYKCGKCGQPLSRQQKTGRYDFWGCTAYKATGCKVSYPSVKGKPDFSKPRGL